MQLHVGTQLDRLLRQPFARRHHHASAAGRRRGVDLGLQVDRLRVRVRQGQAYRPFEHMFLDTAELLHKWVVLVSHDVLSKELEQRFSIVEMDHV